VSLQALRRVAAEALRPPERVSVPDWAERYRIVSPDSGSPQPGRWSNALTPYLVEPMACCSPDDPAASVTVLGSAQGGKTSIAENAIGCWIDRDPASILIVLPTLDEAKKYNRIKLGPLIDATPVLRSKVLKQTSRDEAGSTTFFKKLRGGGFVQVTGANASSGLQMISAKYLVGEEITEFPDDVDGRGDPLVLAEARQLAWLERGAKRVYSSTPGIKGACRITERYLAGDQRQLYAACPHCGTWQTLRFEQLRWDSETAPHGAYLACVAHGCVIAHHEKRAMIAGARWIKTWPSGEGDPPGPESWFEAKEIDRWLERGSEGRAPSFRFWQIVSPFVSWDEIVAQFLAARGHPLKERVFTQQVLGEAFEERGEAPDDEKLFLRREDYRLGRIPDGVCVLTGGIDVQANRLEWAVWGWGPGMSSVLVDRGVIDGSPDDDTVWTAADRLVGRTWPDPRGAVWPCDLWGIDAGYKSHAVYAFSRGRPRVRATNGLAGFMLPMLGTPKKVDCNWKGKPIKGGALLYPMGIYAAKALLYAGLRKTIDGPDANGIWPLGAVRLSSDLDRDYCRQLTAEYLADEATRDGRIRKIWKKKRDQANEALDIWVMARAMAFALQLDRMTAAEWQALAAERGAAGLPAQADLSGLWEAPIGAPSATPNAVRVQPVRETAPPAPARLPEFLDRRPRFDGRPDFLRR
jgi:phage terminase large subunit GpA-like protein